MGQSLRRRLVCDVVDRWEPETRFALGPVGMQTFDIQTGSKWEFRLYGDSGAAPINTHNCYLAAYSRTQCITGCVLTTGNNYD